MKKLLSLVLVLVMVLGLSVTAFAGAGSGVFINGGQPVSPGQVTGNTAITAGTVTFTDSNPEKLTLNNATITENTASPAIMSSVPLEIELAGDNTVTGTQGVQAIKLSSGNLTFSGTGTLIAHGSGSENSPAIVVSDGTVTLPEGYKAVGSTSRTETDISKMTDATFSTENHTFMVGEDKAQTVAIIPASTTEEDAKSGSTEITAVKAAPVSYKIVIPSAVTLTKAGVEEIGAPSVENVENDTANTVISYTATGTQLTLENSEKTMATAYYTDSEGTTALTGDAIEVYKNSALVDPLTTLYIGVTEEAWNAADPGTYKATVTFNFSAVEAEEAEAKTFATVGEVIATVEEEFPTTYANCWKGDAEYDDPPYAYESESNILKVGNEYNATIEYGTSVSESQTTPGDYVAVKEEYNSTYHAYMVWTITFHMTDNVLTSIDAHLEYHKNSSGEKTNDIENYNYTNIKPVVGEPV